jgi:regulator of sigma E protease
MNVVLAIGLLTGVFMVKYPKLPNADGPVVIGHVMPDSPAAAAGIQEGDVIVRMDDVNNPTWEDVLIKELSGAGRAISLVLQRQGKQIVTNVTPVMDERTGGGNAGWSGESEILIAGILPGMHAEKVGLRKGDILLSVDGQPIRSTLKLHEVIRAAAGKPVEIVYSRDGRRDKVSVTPALTNLDGQERWMIGVQLEPRVIITSLPFPQALAESVRRNVKSATVIYSFLRGIVERRMSVSAKSLEGPIRIAQLSGDAAREGPFAFFDLMAMVSLNLAIFNLLPIPILDGGVILLLLVEMIMRRDLSLSVKEAVFKLGFVFLMVLVVFVVYNDLSKILQAG